jgi:hypothetical protein
LEEAGIVVSRSPSLIGKFMYEQMKKHNLVWEMNDLFRCLREWLDICW